MICELCYHSHSSVVGLEEVLKQQSTHHKWTHVVNSLRRGQNVGSRHTVYSRDFSFCALCQLMLKCWKGHFLEGVTK